MKNSFYYYSPLKKFKEPRKKERTRQRERESTYSSCRIERPTIQLVRTSAPKGVSIVLQQEEEEEEEEEEEKREQHNSFSKQQFLFLSAASVQ